MIIESKYNIGDVVKYTVPKRIEKKETCPCCSGTGEIVGNNGINYTCPACNGNKIYESFTLFDQLVEGEVVKIYVRWTEPGDKYMNDQFIRYDIHRLNPKPWYEQIDYNIREEEMEQEG